MKKMMRKMRNRNGFTLAELLIVVAIIAVLVAISIPIFTSQLEKSREAVDAANIRAAYAEAMTEYLTNGGAVATKTTPAAKQKQASWQNNAIDWSGIGVTPDAKTSGSYTVTVNPPASAGGDVSITVN